MALLCECYGKSVLEIKSVYSLRDQDLLTNVNNIDYLVEENNALVLKKSHQHYTQMQCQMAVTGIQRAYLCISNGNGLPLIIEVIKDVGFWKGVEENVDIFYKMYLAPGLLRLTKTKYCAVNGEE